MADGLHWFSVLSPPPVQNDGKGIFLSINQIDKEMGEYTAAEERVEEFLEGEKLTLQKVENSGNRGTDGSSCLSPWKPLGG